MAIVWKKQRERQNVSGDVMDRFIDGKIVDGAEMHDRVVIFQQLGLMIPMPTKHQPKHTF